MLKLNNLKNHFGGDEKKTFKSRGFVLIKKKKRHVVLVIGI